jgi:CrcB protein
MPMIFWVALGGAIGAATRHLVNVHVGRLVGSGFPWATLAINVAGSLVMGMLIELMALRWSASQEMRAFLTVGVLGGFTTFSAFSLETVVLWERGAALLAAIYVLGSVALSILALIFGLWLVRVLA